MTLLTRVAARVSSTLGRENRLIRALRPSYERLLDVASGRRGVEWPVNGEPFRIAPEMRRVVAQQTEPELWEFLRHSVHEGEQALDVGSFLGVYAIQICRWGGPRSRVICFEPTPSIVKVLHRHLALNDAADRVSVVAKALGDEPGFLDLHEHSDPYRNAIGVTDPAGRHMKTSRVPITTIDAVCEERKFVPTLIRMDVQGFEDSVLRGARKTIAAGKGRLRIVLEVHPQLWGLHGMSPEKFDELLTDLGLRAVPLIVGAPRYEPDGHVLLQYI